jgi:hypothetical protein
MIKQYNAKTFAPIPSISLAEIDKIKKYLDEMPPAKEGIIINGEKYFYFAPGAEDGETCLYPVKP